eukprot:gene21708-28732_t
MAEADGTGKSSSICLFLDSDDNSAAVKLVEFDRNEREGGDMDAAAAHILGIDGEKMRCFYVPHMEKKLGYVIHLFIDLTAAEHGKAHITRPVTSAAEHGKAHNTNASQLWLAANLPNEPPEVSPCTINGPALGPLTSLHHFEKAQEPSLESLPQAPLKPSMAPSMSLCMTE